LPCRGLKGLKTLRTEELKEGDVTKKRGGRPPIASGEYKARSVGFRCTNDEYKELKAKADQTGVTVGAYCREVAIKKRKLVQKAPRINMETYAELKRIGVNINQAVKKGYITNADILQQINNLRLWALGVQNDPKY
jgi:hypothetical protein